MRGSNSRPWAHKTHALTNWANRACAPGGFRSRDLLVISQITIPKSDLSVKMLEDDSALPLSYKGSVLKLYIQSYELYIH